MKTKFLTKYFILTLMFLFLISTGVMASSKYVDDGAGVLSSSTQDKISTNFEKVEKNSGAVVKMVTVKSLNKQDVKSVAQDYANKNLSGNKYVLFLVAPNDGKTQLLIGSGLNAVFNSSDIDKISHLSDSDFKSKDFNNGFSKVGQALDQKITSTAVKTGDAVVKSDGYSNTVKPATPWGKYFLIFLVILIIAIIIFIVFKKMSEKEYEKKKKKFAQDNNIDDYNSGSDTFKTASVGKSNYSTKSTYVPKEESHSTYTEPINTSINDSYTETVHETINNNTNNYSGSSAGYSHAKTTSSKTTSHSTGNTTHTTVNHTTIVNNNNNNNRGYGYNNDNGFVEGMIVGEALNELSHDHHHHHDDYHNDYHEEHHHSSYKEPEREVTSGDWDNNGTSNWGSSSSSSSSGSSSWGSSSDSDYGSSSKNDDYDSSSSYDSGSSWDSGSDSGSSDW